MTHHRTKIREAVVDLLKGATSAGMNVFPSRIGPLWNMPLPLILIYLRDETVSPISSLPKPRERKPQLAIEVRANAADETAEATLSLMEEIAPTMVLSFLGIRIYPHTKLAQLALEEGVLQPGQVLLQPAFYRAATFDVAALRAVSPPEAGLLRPQAR